MHSKRDTRIVPVIARFSDFNKGVRNNGSLSTSRDKMFQRKGLTSSKNKT